MFLAATKGMATLPTLFGLTWRQWWESHLPTGLQENWGPAFFLSLMGLCALMIGAGALGDYLAKEAAERKKREAAEEESGEEGADAKKLTGADKKRVAKERKQKRKQAKSDSKARAKQMKQQKKLGKKAMVATTDAPKADEPKADEQVPEEQAAATTPDRAESLSESAGADAEHQEVAADAEHQDAAGAGEEHQEAAADAEPVPDSAFAEEPLLFDELNPLEEPPPSQPKGK